VVLELSRPLEAALLHMTARVTFLRGVCRGSGARMVPRSWSQRWKWRRECVQDRVFPPRRRGGLAEEVDWRKQGIVVTLGEWPVRILKHRGLADKKSLLTRPGTPEEEAEIKAFTRCVCYTYQFASGLIEEDHTQPGDRPTASFGSLFCLTAKL
jgi:hypothetical protein